MVHGDGSPRLTEPQPWLRDLHARHFDRLVRIAERMLPPPATANAEDIVQTVFAEAVAASLREPEIQVGAGWLIRRLRSRIADHHRHSRRQRRLLEAATAHDAPPSAAEIAIDRSAVHDLLAVIPDPADRLALALRIQGYREQEIAVRLCVDYGGRQVRDRMRRIRRRVSAHRAAATSGPDVGPCPAVDGPAA